MQGLLFSRKLDYLKYRLPSTKFLFSRIKSVPVTVCFGDLGKYLKCIVTEKYQFFFTKRNLNGSARFTPQVFFDAEERF